MLSSGVETGTGCVYPAEVPNIGTQLSAKKLTWKAYMEDMGNNPNREAAACGHPGLEATDETQKAVAGDGYATRHDPFVYFHSVIDEQAYCDTHVVALGSPTGASALADIDTFLETWVPQITSSQAYRENGLLEIVFDEAANSETEACCEEMPGPGSPEPGITGPGGGRDGAVLLSPFIKPATVSSTPYNHYSSLASWESLFGLPRLADAASVPAIFASDVFTGAR
jgi:hypothetical protein